MTAVLSSPNPAETAELIALPIRWPNEPRAPNTPVTLTAGIGYNDGSLGLVSPDGQYIDWSVGASFAAGPATFTVQYIDTDVKKSGIKALDTLYDPTVVFTLGASF